MIYYISSHQKAKRWCCQTTSQRLLSRPKKRQSYMLLVFLVIKFFLTNTHQSTSLFWRRPKRPNGRSSGPKYLFKKKYISLYLLEIETLSLRLIILFLRHAQCRLECEQRWALPAPIWRRMELTRLESMRPTLKKRALVDHRTGAKTSRQEFCLFFTTNYNNNNI